jgi:hypothetical protein
MKAFGCLLLLLTTFLTLVDASKAGLRKSTSQQQRRNQEHALLPLVWEQITYDDFESGWGSYTDGGGDVDLREDSRKAHSGDYSARIRDDSEEKSSIYHTKDKDVSAYSLLRVHFWYYPKGMKNGRGFVVEYSTDGGGSWQALQRFVEGIDFVSDDLFYYADLKFSSVGISKIKLRFRCDGKDDKYQIYLDEINFEGTLASTPMPTVAPSTGPLVWEQITYDDFESGWGTYTDGGRDADLQDDSRKAHSGDYSARIRDDSEEKSSIYHTKDKDVSAYSLLKVHFWYYPKGMKDGRGFVVEYSTDGGGSWQELKRFVDGDDFVNDDLFYYAALEFSSEGMSKIKLRFRCDGKGNKAQIYLDEINFEGALTSTTTPTDAPTARPTPSHSPIDAPTPGPTDTLSRDDICPLGRLYPPAKYEILPFMDTNVFDHVEDDLAEISSLAFSTQTDAQGSKYAYVVSDKNQFSIKVIKFTEDQVTTNFLAGSAETVAV